MSRSTPDRSPPRTIWPVDSDKVAFLFGKLPVWADPDDPDERTGLLSREIDEHEPGAALHLAIRTAVANQIADDDPPQVWATAQRLLLAGHDRDDVMRQLVLALTPQVLSAVHGNEPFTLEDYLSALDRLPLPTATDCEQAMLAVTLTRPSTPVAEFDRLVAARLGLVVDDPLVEVLLGQVGERLMDPGGPLEMLAGDHVVHVEALTDGIVLTHRITPFEYALGALPLDVDLAGFRRRDPLNLPDGRPIEVTGDSWAGPVGWLADLPADSVVAIRVNGGVLSIAPLENAPPVAADLVALIRAGYDLAVAEPWLPVPVEELIFHARLAEPTAFMAPAAPLTQLLSAAGLEVRDAEVAHEESVWRNSAQVSRTARLVNQLGTGELTKSVLHVLDLVDNKPADTATARHVLEDLYDPAVLDVVANEMLGTQDDPEQLHATAALARRLLAAASQAPHRAVAHWLSAVVAEREGHVAEAETQLRAAVRVDPGWAIATDRFAWYCSDRGDAETALSLWRGIGATSASSDDVRLLESFTTATDRPRPGRNERCWCGSGRKFKQCHLGRTALPPLPERVGWLCRKATAYLERRGGAATEVIYEHAYARAVDEDDEDAVLAALEDPLVIDVALHEGGWFDRFLADRGALLPDDEALLASAWTLVDRTIYELAEVRAGVGVTVRDLRTGEVCDVRERTFSAVATPRTLICARAVPDGESHQFIGGLFGVAPGTESGLLELLDDRDGFALLEYVADLHRPPVIVGPDGQVIDLADFDPGDIDPDDLPALPLNSPDVQTAMLEFLETHEQKWCEEDVPALGGITPIQAAADPTRRDALIRLIDSFPTPDPATGVFALRPERLRELLDLPPLPPF